LTGAYPNVYLESATTNAPHGSSYVQFALAKKEGASKLGIAYCVEIAICKESLPSFQKVAASAGVTLVSEQGVSATSASYAAPCLAMKSAGADLFYPDITQAVIPLFLTQCKEQGWTPLVAGSTIAPYWATNPIFNHFAGSTQAFPWFENAPVANTYRQAMQTYDPAALQGTLTVGPVVWTGGLLFEAGAQAGHLGDNPTSQQLMAGLDTLQNDTLGGASVPLTFTNGNRAQDCGFAISASNGQFTTPLGTDPICGTP
jgi:branched-chain amino acid transport system substrate-binding protein